MLPTLTPIDTIGYTYNSTDWTDQLVQYGNETISYDAMGNPLTYRGYTFGWRGKQLTTASNGTDTLSFEYNEDGLRQQKTVNNVDTNYFYNGSVLIGMQRGTDKLLFSYDAAGNVVSVNYNGTEYYYLRNAQGDIVKLIDASGTTVVEYTYDTWGKKVTTTGTLAGTLGLFQPFRYRGYVYDWETGFYYLQSRYYDPTTGRFISADVLLSTGQGVLGNNAYAYCLDNPVNMVDDGGTVASSCVMLRSDEAGGFVVVHFEYGEEEQAIEYYKSGHTVYYRDVLIVSSPFSSSCAMFGLIFLKHDQLNDMDWAIITLKHEFGHIEQERRIGTIKYLLTIGVLSLGGYALSTIIPEIKKNYFNLAVERGADDYGGVTENERKHSWLSDLDWFIFRRLIIGDFS